MASRSQKPILVTGAGGRVGGVSTYVTSMLIAKGFPVRAQVRKDDERAEALRKQGAEVVVGDLTVLSDVHRIISGCSRVYFSFPVVGNFLEASLLFIAVAKHHGVELLVNMSQLSVALMSIERSLPSPQARAHWLAEQALLWSGVPFVNVQPTVFLENPFFHLWAKESISANNELRIPFGKANIAPIAAVDVARAVATILENPPPHIGKSYRLLGPTLYSMEEIAKQYSKGLGREIKYVPADADQFSATVIQKSIEDGTIDQHAAKHLQELAKLMQTSARTIPGDNSVGELTGTPALDVWEWVQQHAAEFQRAAK